MWRYKFSVKRKKKKIIDNKWRDKGFFFFQIEET